MAARVEAQSQNRDGDVVFATRWLSRLDRKPDVGVARAVAVVATTGIRGTPTSNEMARRLRTMRPRSPIVHHG